VALETLQEKLHAKKPKTTLTHWLKNTLRLSPQKIAFFYEMAKPAPVDVPKTLKHLPVRYAGLRPMDEAISTAGGVKQAAVDEGLMLTNMPGVFCAGEMLDWEAPTGGYLLTACLATGRWAGRAAADWVHT
jgi:predicted flavoprotein YhiN